MGWGIPMSFYLALDAGGTKTDYLLADESRELARVCSGTIKRMRADAQTAALHLDTALTELTARTGVPLSAVTRTCVGTAGESVPLVADWLRAAFQERVAGDLVLLGDVEIALDAAFPGGAGVLVLAGTGSNVAGRGSDGRLTTAGGWGPALADQGSGHRIGHEALRAAFLAQDEGQPTLLPGAVMEFWGLASMEALIEYANAIPAPDYSRLTRLVVRCAEQGDLVAANVLRNEGEALAYLARLVLRRICKHAGQEPPPPMAFAGSILKNVAPVRDALIAAVKSEFPAIEAHQGIVDPIQGALWHARNGHKS
jgi:N-acetylglucosamine kinase-like BadF-type ATPase